MVKLLVTIFLGFSLALASRSTRGADIDLHFQYDSSTQQMKDITPPSRLCLATGMCPGLDIGLHLTTQWGGSNPPLQVRRGSQSPQITIRNGQDYTQLTLYLELVNFFARSQPGQPPLELGRFQQNGFNAPFGCKHKPGVEWQNGIVSSWRAVSTTGCSARWSGPVVDVEYDAYLGYDRMPRAERLTQGTYTGSGTFKMGSASNAIYWFGDTAPEIEVRFNVQVDVITPFLISFPSAVGGLVTAQLEPQGGWSAWTGRDRPSQFDRDVPFRITTEGRISVYALCDKTIGTSCAVDHADGGDPHPLDARLSVPGTADRSPIPTSASAPLVFGPGQGQPTLQNAPGSVHLQVAGPLAREGNYAGRMTLVFDAE